MLHRGLPTRVRPVESRTDAARTRRVGRPIHRLSTSRAALLAKLADQPEPVTLAALVRATGLHENTIREHLDGLVRARLVERHRAEPVGRGRPAWLYAATDRGSFDVEYAGLAAALARTVVRTSDRPTHAAALAGEEWGRELARGRGADASSAAEARQHVLDVLDDLGFQCESDEQSPAEVRLTRCPLLEAAYRHTEVVCAVHVGLVRGVLQENGADPTGTQLSPFSEPHACGLVVPPLPGPGTAQLPSGRSRTLPS
jgi:predicted ArsR family transcriptional regulator